MTKDKNKKSADKESASFFKELGQFMKPYRGGYTASVLLSLFSVAAGIISYGFTGAVAGMLFRKNPSFEKALFLIAMVVVCKLLHTVILNLSTWISHKATYKTLADIRFALTEKMINLPMGYFEEKGTGRLKAMLVDHVEGMEKTLAHMLPEMTANFLGPAACIIWMFFLDWRLALAMLIWICLGFSVTGGLMKGYEEKYAGQIKRFKGMNQAIVEFVNGIEVIKNFGRSDVAYKKFSDAVYEHAEYNLNWQKESQVYSALGMAIAPFSLFPVLMLGLVLFNRGSVTPETLFMFIILSFGIFGPLMNTMSYFDQLAAMGTNAKEIRDVLDYPELKRAGSSVSGKSGLKDNIGKDIEFSDVSFSYDGEHDAVSDISFKVPEGTMLALAGPSGSGKSTIAKLLGGFWDADKGDIKIGGRSICEYSQEQLNSLIAYVDQETFLFDESILDNIRIGCPEKTREQVIKAATDAGCDQFISALPDGYDTMAGVAGGRLSGGEKQRIAIARAMMKDAPIMILDEATASADPENEASIQKALSAAAKNKTLIVIAHHLDTIVSAQQIAYVEEGKIRAIGSHETLLKESEDYRKMWELSGGDR